MEEQIDDQTWWNRLSRRMQKDLIDCLELSWTEYFDLSATDVKRAREFYLSCQVK